jgi:beta-glucosidase
MTDADTPPYRQSDRSTETRVDDLLDRMTPEEKVGQLLVSPKKGPVEDIIDEVKSEIETHALGQVSPFGRTRAPDDPRAVALMLNELQRYAVSETRLGIPLLVTCNAVHGNAYMQRAPVYPHPLGMAATRDEQLVESLSSATADALDALGAHQNYDPVCDLGPEPRWGRLFETFGESPYLTARLSAAKVHGYRGNGPGDDGSVLATAKHFPAYGSPVRGEDAAVVEISRHALYNYFLPPFEAAIEAGADAVMACYNSIDGEPVHGSERYLETLLRETLGFDGFVVADYNGVDMLADGHGIAESQADAVRLAARAGIDAWLNGAPGESYAGHLLSLVDGGDISEERLNRSVRPVLRAKFDLGLFEDPYVDVDRAVEIHERPADHALALESAAKSLVLLENDGLLPFDGPDEVALVGPVGDDVDTLLGGWSRQDSERGTTLRDALRTAAPAGTTVSYEQGASIRERSDIDDAVRTAASADAAVVALGEPQYLHDYGLSPTAGDVDEFPNRTTLELPSAQRTLLEAVAETGTPTVLVLSTGRPVIVGDGLDLVGSVLAAFYPGSAGGTAIAQTLFGDRNPSGALPISWPRSEGQLPQRFNHLSHPKVLGREGQGPSYDPLYPFGHGLSYTEFAYRDLVVEPVAADRDASRRVSVAVENTGDRSGATTIDCYLRDLTSSVITPERRLVGFDRVNLDPGETARVSFVVRPRDLAVTRSDGERVVEPGTFTLRLGSRTARLTVVAPN